jgi:hypothetical protein
LIDNTFLSMTILPSTDFFSGTSCISNFQNWQHGSYICQLQLLCTVLLHCSSKIKLSPVFLFWANLPSPSSIHMDLAASAVWLRLAPQARLVRSVSKNHSTHRTVGGREGVVYQHATLEKIVAAVLITECVYFCVRNGVYIYLS